MLSFYSNLATHLCIFFFCFSSAYITNRNISVTEADVRYVMSCYCCDTRKQLMKEMARMSYWNPELEEMMVAPRWFPTWQLFLHHQLHGHLLFHFETQLMLTRVWFVAMVTRLFSRLFFSLQCMRRASTRECLRKTSTTWWRAIAVTLAKHFWNRSKQRRGYLYIHCKCVIKTIEGAW